DKYVCPSIISAKDIFNKVYEFKTSGSEVDHRPHSGD
uniref:Uncharacterized protein n=1 Tax=Oncorhynchus kisutch TaxID=8019 RepID=A0A8C7CP92_ONCKI